jgi:hypothetical protein
MQRLDRLEHKIEALLERLDDVEKNLRKGRLKKIDDNVDALIRQAFLKDTDLPEPHATLSRRFTGLSQNEEDGITLALFARIGAPGRRFVEIGAGVNGGNSGFLATECGWTGVMFELDPRRVRTLVERFGSSCCAVQGAVTRDNVDELLTRHGMSGEVDLLSLDIDGNDYWVWERLSAVTPRLLIVEFNPFFGVERSVAVPYDPAFDRRQYNVKGCRYYGASLPAFGRLAARKGYRLVAVEPRGVNAFFVRGDLAGDLSPLDAGAAAVAAKRDYHVAPDALFAELERAGLPLVEID